MTESLFRRIVALLKNPRSELDKLSYEQLSIHDIIIWIATLVMLRGIAGLIGFGLVRKDAFFSVFVSELITAILLLIMVGVYSYLLDVMAGRNHSHTHHMRAVKLSAYVFIPFLAAGLLRVIPILAVFQLIGFVFSLFILYASIQKMLGIHETDVMRVFVLLAIALLILIAVSSVVEFAIRTGEFGIVYVI